MYEIVINPELVPVFDDLKVKDPHAYGNLKKKIYQIAEILQLHPNHCKNLKKPLQRFKRVHVNKAFVIVFEVDTQNKLMIIHDYDHHNRIYKKSF